MKTHAITPVSALVVMTLFLLPTAASAQPLTPAEQALTKEKILSYYIKINAPVDSVWSRWATEPGLRKFFAPACHLEAMPLGRLDILFAPDAPAGQRGAEDNRI